MTRVKRANLEKSTQLRLLLIFIFIKFSYHSPHTAEYSAYEMPTYIHWIFSLFFFFLLQRIVDVLLFVWNNNKSSDFLLSLVFPLFSYPPVRLTTICHNSSPFLPAANISNDRIDGVRASVQKVKKTRLIKASTTLHVTFSRSKSFRTTFSTAPELMCVCVCVWCNCTSQHSKRSAYALGLSLVVILSLSLCH